MTSTLYIELTGLYFSPLSAFSSKESQMVTFVENYELVDFNEELIFEFNYVKIHGGYILDAFLYHNKLNSYDFLHTDFLSGGVFDTSFLYETIIGGDFSLYYDDLQDNQIILKGDYIFCKTDILFDLSNFDQSESKITKIIFDPNNGSKIETVIPYFSDDGVYHIKATYYPSEDYYTFYNPKFNIYYENGTLLNIVYPLTCVQCGIYDSYKDKNIVETMILNSDKSNILLFINDNSTDDLSILKIFRY